MATTIQDNVNNYYFKNQADFEAHKAEIPNNSTIYIEETGEVNVEINGTETENVENLTNIVVGDKTYKVVSNGGEASVSTGGLNIAQEVLWTNSNPTAAFTAQSINTSSPVTDFDYILYHMKVYAGDNAANAYYIGKPLELVRLSASNNAGQVFLTRDVISPLSSNIITFNSGYTSNNSDTNVMIPYQIIGIKFLDTLDYSTEEQYTGKHWIDGKKIYQKTFIIVLLQKNVEVTQDFDCSNIDIVINTSKNNNYYIPQQYTVSGLRWYIDRQNNRMVAVSQDYSEFVGTFNITIQYTKTTE
mgnify:CR=1 FL=1